MEEGKNYEEACAEAQVAELIEEDPSMDVDGWDAALKTTILAKILFKIPFCLQDVERTGISRVTPGAIQEALIQNSRIKLLAELRLNDGKIQASVRPTSLPLSNPLAQVKGRENMVNLYTDNLGTISLRGTGGGGLPTAQALLSDLLSIARYPSYRFLSSTEKRGKDSCGNTSLNACWC
jgi:homoserine dehydrogenase